jgi:hypothetical protein
MSAHRGSRDRTLEFEFPASLMIQAKSEDEARAIAVEIASNLNGQAISSDRPGLVQLIFLNDLLVGGPIVYS